jgi:uncharacterized protein (TIGR03086 family)
METVNSLHRQALDHTGAIIAAIKPDQWNQPTPCECWDVRALTNHIVAGNLWAAELVGGKTIEQVGDRLDGDVLGGDPADAYARSAAVAADAFDAPGALESPCAVSYGPVPGAVYAGHRFIDVLIHGWDVAIATGQNTELDPQLVTACAQIVEPQASALRASGAFGSTDEPAPPGANEQTCLLMTLGRHP